MPTLVVPLSTTLLGMSKFYPREAGGQGLKRPRNKALDQLYTLNSDVCAIEKNTKKLDICPETVNTKEGVRVTCPVSEKSLRSVL